MKLCFLGDANGPLDKSVECGDYSYDTCVEGVCSSYPTCSGCVNNEECGWCENGKKCLLSTSEECGEKFFYGKSVKGKEQCPQRQVFKRNGNDTYMESAETV